ncbi:site-2 protease family protein, partial [Vibrio sp. 10N.261.45.A7]
MELLAIEFLGKPLRLEGSMAGWQQLYWDNTLVSQLNATTNQEDARTHEFTLRAGEETLQCHVESTVQWQPFEMTYKASVNGQTITEGNRNTKDIEQQTPVVAPKPEKRFSLIGLVSLGMKALKSAKLI